MICRSIPSYCHQVNLDQMFGRMLSQDETSQKRGHQVIQPIVYTRTPFPPCIPCQGCRPLNPYPQINTPCPSLPLPLSAFVNHHASKPTRAIKMAELHWLRSIRTSTVGTAICSRLCAPSGSRPCVVSNKTVNG